jgi:hypothetical protein
VIAMSVRLVIFVPVFVVVIVRFTCGIVVMDVRMVSSTMAMIERAHDIDRTFPPFGQCGVQIGTVPNR